MKVLLKHRLMMADAMHKGCYDKERTLGKLIEQVKEQKLGNDHLMYALYLALNWARKHLPEHYVSDVVYVDGVNDDHLASALRWIYSDYNKGNNT